MSDGNDVHFYHLDYNQAIRTALFLKFTMNLSILPRETFVGTTVIIMNLLHTIILFFYNLHTIILPYWYFVLTETILLGYININIMRYTNFNILCF